MKKYNVIFNGGLNGEYDLITVKAKFQKFFNLSQIKVEYLFTGKDIKIKTECSQTQALKYVSKIDEMGGICYIEPVDDTELPKGVLYDRRFSVRRVNPERRHSFRSDKKSDRRSGKDRRKNPY